MIYIFVDTNIWVRVISQGRPGCELVHFVALRNLVEQGKAILILPEIVELELEKCWRAFTDDLTKGIGQMEKQIGEVLKQKSWSEIEDVKGSIAAFLQGTREQKRGAAQRHFDGIQEFFQSKQIVRVPLTPDLLFRSRKRLIAGRMPEAENKASNDACIIESLTEFFRGRSEADAQLYFCTDNQTDFGLETSEGLVLHPLVKDGLPPTKYTTTLRELVAFYRSNQPVAEPPNAEIQEALERRLIESGPPLEYTECAEDGCDRPLWAIGPFCHGHFREHLSALPADDRKRFVETLNRVLKTLTYREREVFRLRTGFGDGYVYTQEECGRIFKRSTSTIRRVEQRAFRKLRHPLRAKEFDEFF
ncbi:MAG TPA: PIN domain-containing protein [Gemmataceae bacterium]|jgi:hypothetical protein